MADLRLRLPRQRRPADRAGPLGTAWLVLGTLVGRPCGRCEPRVAAVLAEMRALSAYAAECRRREAEHAAACAGQVEAARRAADQLRAERDAEHAHADEWHSLVGQLVEAVAHARRQADEWYRVALDRENVAARLRDEVLHYESPQHRDQCPVIAAQRRRTA